MPNFFDAKQQPFLPRGYVSLRSALQSYVRYWVEKNVIRETSNPINNDEDNYTQLWPDEGDRFIEKNLINIEIDSEVWGKFRQVLYADEISARSIDASGELREIPQSYWGSDDAITVCNSGEVEGAARLEYGGRVIIQEQELEDLLAGRPRPARGGPPPQGLVILAPSDPQTLSTYLPLGYIGIKEVVKAFLDREKSVPRALQGIDNKDYKSPPKMYEEAHEETRKALASGALPSFHKQLFEGVIRPLKATDWLPGGAVITGICPERRVSGYKWMWRKELYINTSEGRIIGNVIVRLEDLIVFFKHADTPSLSNIKLMHNGKDRILVNRNIGGRPPKYDDKLFLMEAMSIIYYEGPPATQAELCEKALNAYEAAGHRGDRPSDDWAKKEIRPLWRKLKLDGDG